MAAKLPGFIAGLAALALSGVATLAPAGEGPSPHAHPRIEVNPGRLLYRRCEVRYVLQHRPSGTVLYPEQYCWWVRG
jgi:hypothetical protein